MNREIMKIVNRVVSEEFSGRISNIKNRLFENKGSEMCEACGSGDMYEGECMECGNTYEGNIQELGGMDDGHPTLGKKRLPNKMSIEDIEKLLRGDDYRGENGPAYRGPKGYDDASDSYTDMGGANDEEEGFPKWEKLKKQMDDGGELEEDVCEECGDMSEDEVEEGNEFSGELARARKDGKKTFTVDGKTYPVKESKVYFTESEIIDIIENIVKEEKKKGKAPSAQNILKSTLGQSKKENEENIKKVAKKMKEYLKDGSKGKYDPNPKYFPKGNGEIEKMEKMAFSLTDENEDFNYEIAGLNIPVPDAIEFNDERMDKYYEGSSETGNAPGGNAIESEANSRFNKMRKKQTLHKLKQQSYNKSPQPVFNEKSGQEKGKGINIKLESTEDKKVISEMEKIKNLIGYNRKTQ
jgi:hypothetical protein